MTAKFFLLSLIIILIEKSSNGEAGKNRPIRSIAYARSSYNNRGSSSSSSSKGGGTVRGGQSMKPQHQRWQSGGGWSRHHPQPSAMRKAPPSYLPYPAGPGRPPSYMVGAGRPAAAAAYYSAPANYHHQRSIPQQQFYAAPPPGYGLMHQQPPPQMMMQQPPPVFSGPIVMQPDNDGGDELGGSADFNNNYYPQQQQQQWMGMRPPPNAHFQPHYGPPPNSFGYPQQQQQPPFYPMQTGYPPQQYMPQQQQQQQSQFLLPYNQNQRQQMQNIQETNSNQQQQQQQQFQAPPNNQPQSNINNNQLLDVNVQQQQQQQQQQAQQMMAPTQNQPSFSQQQDQSNNNGIPLQQQTLFQQQGLQQSSGGTQQNNFQQFVNQQQYATKPAQPAPPQEQASAVPIAMKPPQQPFSMSFSPAPQKSVQEAVQQALLHQQQNPPVDLTIDTNRKASWQQQIQEAIRHQQQQQQMRQHQTTTNSVNNEQEKAELRSIAVEAVTEYGRIRMDDSTEPELVEGLLLPENRRLVKCGEKKFVSTQAKLPTIRCCGTRAFNTMKLACLNGRIVDEHAWLEATAGNNKNHQLTMTTTMIATTSPTPTTATDINSYRNLAMAALGHQSSSSSEQQQGSRPKSIGEARLVDLAQDEIRRRYFETVDNNKDNGDENSHFSNNKQEQEKNMIQVDLTSGQQHQSSQPSSTLLDLLQKNERELLSKIELIEMFRRLQDQPPSSQTLDSSLDLPNGTFTLRCGGQSWLTGEPPSFFACCGDILNRLERVSCEQGDEVKPPLLINYDASDRGRKLPKGVALALTDSPSSLLVPTTMTPPPELVPGEPEPEQQLQQWALDGDDDSSAPPALVGHPGMPVLNDGVFITPDPLMIMAINDSSSSLLLAAKSRDAVLAPSRNEIDDDDSNSDDETSPQPSSLQCHTNDPTMFCCGKFLYRKQAGQVCCEGNYGIIEGGQMDCCGPIPFNIKTHGCSESSYVVLRR